MSYRVSWQDYRGWRQSDIREKHPRVQHRDFLDKEEATAFAARMRDMGYTAGVSPTPRDKRGRRKITLKEQTRLGGEIPFNADWRLTK